MEEASLRAAHAMQESMQLAEAERIQRAEATDAAMAAELQQELRAEHAAEQERQREREAVELAEAEAISRCDGAIGGGE